MHLVILNIRYILFYQWWLCAALFHATKYHSNLVPYTIIQGDRVHHRKIMYENQFLPRKVCTIYQVMMRCVRKSIHQTQVYASRNLLFLSQKVNKYALQPKLQFLKRDATQFAQALCIATGPNHANAFFRISNIFLATCFLSYVFKHNVCVKSHAKCCTLKKSSKEKGRVPY